MATPPTISTANLERLLAVPHVPLGRWPSPIDSIVVEGREVLIKRDDLSGHGRGGAKTRKIEFVLGHMLATGKDELVTIAGNVTNVIFDVLPALEKVGLRSQLMIIDDPPARSDDREQIFAGVRDRITLLSTSRTLAGARALAAAAASRARGRHPFLSLPGLSHPAGIVGNARGFVEMVLQREEAGLPLPETVWITAATGCTIAGFLIAEHALRLAGRPPIHVVGVQVYPGNVRAWTLGLMRWTERFLGVDDRVPMARIDIRDDAVYGGFGCFPAALAAQCEQTAHDVGIRVDPIFGGKTWSTMVRALRTERPAPTTGPTRPTLYWHCGYTPEWQVLGQVVQRGAEVV